MSISSVNSNKTSSTHMSGKDLCSTQEEKECYDRIEKEIQRVFTQKKPLGSVVVEINPTRYCNYKYDEKETHLSPQVQEHLADKFKARGFEASIIPHRYRSVTTTCSGSSIKVAISDEVRDESGYVSEGLDESFKNSIVRPLVLENRQNTYVAKAREIEDTLRSKPKIYRHEFSLKGVEEIVEGWIKTDLEDRGFKVKSYKDKLIVSKPFLEDVNSPYVYETTASQVAILGKSINS